MEDWFTVTLLLCAFGTLRELRPSEPFVSEFLSGPWRNVTDEQLNREVYPVGTYSYMAQLTVIFLVTDFLRFKPIIIISGLSGIIIYAILLWTKSIPWLQVSQFFYGTYMATDVAYYTYIYAKVDSSKYPRVSSYTRIAALVGRSLSGLSAQLLTHFGLMNYRELNYITFASQILATFWALWLPPVQYGIYFHRKGNAASIVHVDINAPLEKRVQIGTDKDCKLTEGGGATRFQRTFHDEVVEASSLIMRHASAAYRRPRVVVWSALYAVTLTLFVQVQIYVQLLWRQIEEENGRESHEAERLNGAVEAVQTLAGAGSALVASLVTRAPLPALAAALQAAALFLGTYYRNMYAAYAGYIVLGVLYNYVITLASVKISSQLSDESCFGLIFGINTLVGTVLQSLLTLLLTAEARQLSIAQQFYYVSALYAALAALWLAGWAAHALWQRRNVKANDTHL